MTKKASTPSVPRRRILSRVSKARVSGALPEPDFRARCRHHARFASLPVGGRLDVEGRTTRLVRRCEGLPIRRTRWSRPPSGSVRLRPRVAGGQASRTASGQNQMRARPRGAPSEVSGPRCRHSIERALRPDRQRPRADQGENSRSRRACPRAALAAAPDRPDRAAIGTRISGLTPQARTAVSASTSAPRRPSRSTTRSRRPSRGRSRRGPRRRSR